MRDISQHVADRLIAYAAEHGATATRALAEPWGLSKARIDTFCRENATAINRARLANATQAAAKASGRTADAASRKRGR